MNRYADHYHQSLTTRLSKHFPASTYSATIVIILLEIADSNGSTDELTVLCSLHRLFICCLISIIAGKDLHLTMNEPLYKSDCGVEPLFTQRVRAIRYTKSLTFFFGMRLPIPPPQFLILLIQRCPATMHIHTPFLSSLYINGLSYGSHVVCPYAGSLIPPHASYYSRRPSFNEFLSQTNMPPGIAIVVAPLLFPYLLFFLERLMILYQRGPESNFPACRIEHALHISSYYRSRTLQFFLCIPDGQPARPYTRNLYFAPTAMLHFFKSAQGSIKGREQLHCSYSLP